MSPTYHLVFILALTALRSRELFEVDATVQRQEACDIRIQCSRPLRAPQLERLQTSGNILLLSSEACTTSIFRVLVSR